MTSAAPGGPVDITDWAVFHVGQKITCPVNTKRRQFSAVCGRVLGEVDSGLVYVGSAALRPTKRVESWPSHRRICPGCSTMLEVRAERRVADRAS